MKLVPRDYQEAAIEALFSFLRYGQGHPIVNVPTGGGKSVIIAEFLRRALERIPEGRFLVATHVKELIEQNHDELVGQWDGLCPSGIFSAGLKRRDLDATITFVGIQSVSHRAEDFGFVNALLIDEAHLVPKSGQGRYRTFIEGLREINPDLRVIGFTATPYRMNGGHLHKGKGAIFTDIVYDVPVELLIERGHLAPLVPKRTDSLIDTTEVPVSSTGDFKSAEMESAAMAVLNASVKETVETARAQGRTSWLIFASGIEHARAIQELLVSKYSVTCETIFGDTDAADRVDIVRRFKCGEITALVNVGVLTTGFNAPRVDLLAVMRATQSASLYVQIMGRGMRTFTGKENCLVLDYGRNVERHGPINKVDPSASKGTGDGTGEPPVKCCPQCNTYTHPTAAECLVCGYLWTPEEIQLAHDREASRREIIEQSHGSAEVKLVSDFDVKRHTKTDKPDSLRVTYMCGLSPISEWVCLEHTGTARKLAAKWWLRRAQFPVPKTVTEALERVDEITVPVAIAVKPEGKYLRPTAHYNTPDDVPEHARAKLFVEGDAPDQGYEARVKAITENEEHAF